MTAVRGARTTLRYRDLVDRLDGWADDLRGLDLQAGSLVALDVVDATYLAPAHLAVRAAGHVPMLLDPHLAPRRRSALLDASRPALVMAVQERAEIDPFASNPRTLPSKAGYLGFTSGTQGTPKGIVSYEPGVMHFAAWEARTIGLRRGTPVGMISAPTFEVVFRELFMTLLGGGELVPATSRVRADPSAVIPWLADHEVEVVHAVPGLATRWLTASPEHPMPFLSWTLFAGEPLHGSQVRAWRVRAPRSEVINLYGPSETTLAKFFYHVPPDPSPGIQPVGRPLPDTDLQRLPLSTPGNNAGKRAFQIGIATPYGSLGYLDGTGTDSDHQVLRREFGRTIFSSQDIGEIDDAGNLVVLGRLDSRVKRRGVFVDLARIEAAATDVPGVGLSCCVQTSAATGSAVALVVESADEDIVVRLRRELRGALGPDGPDHVLVVQALPLSPNAKVDRRAVAGLAETAIRRGPKTGRK